MSPQRTSTIILLFLIYECVKISLAFAPPSVSLVKSRRTSIDSHRKHKDSSNFIVAAWKDGNSETSSDWCSTMSIIYNIPGVRFVQTKLNQLTSYVPPPPYIKDDGAMAKILVIHCHPVPDSFSETIAKTFIDSATISGHKVRSISLYEHPDDPTKCYRPNLSRMECENYAKKNYQLEPEVQAHFDLLLWCDTIVFVYPTWWMTVPASLKGFFDRTLVPGLAFGIPTQTTGLVPKLINIKRIIGLSTYGLRQAIVTLAGDHGRSLIANAFRFSTCPNASVLWMGMYNVPMTSKEQREMFLNKVANIPKDI